MEDSSAYLKTILTDDHPVLRLVSEPVTTFDGELETLIKSMVATMFHHEGIGLSAVQIGVTQRVIIAYTDQKLYVLVNPVFIRKLNRFNEMVEGCLSLPGVKRKVSRPAKCELRWQDMEGNEHTGNFSGLLARIVQHEMDHLDGILIIDKPVA